MNIRTEETVDEGRILDIDLDLEWKYRPLDDWQRRRRRKYHYPRRRPGDPLVGPLVKSPSGLVSSGEWKPRNRQVELDLEVLDYREELDGQVIFEPRREELHRPPGCRLGLNYDRPCWNYPNCGDQQS